MARINWGELENSASQKMEAGKYYTREELAQILTDDELKAVARNSVRGRTKFSGAVKVHGKDGLVSPIVMYKLNEGGA